MPQDRIDDVYQTLLQQSEIQSKHHAEAMKEMGNLTARVNAVLEQATRTNGRVSSLEDDVEEIKRDQALWKGRIATGSAVVGVGVVVGYDWLKAKLGW